MALSEAGTLRRIERLETDMGEVKRTLVHISEVLVSLSERVESGFRSVDVRLQAVDGRFHAMEARMLALEQSQHGVIERLDRLIDMTLRERTHTTERFGDVERRLMRLEEHVGSSKP